MALPEEEDEEVRRFAGPSVETVGLVAHYGFDGLPACREFATAKEARVSFRRMVEFRSRLKAKNVGNYPEERSEVVLYAKVDGMWVCEKSFGSAANLVRLSKWLGLRTRRPLEGRFALAFAYVLGYAVRGVLYVVALRKAPTLEKASSWPGFCVRIANILVRFGWPYLRVAVNDFVRGFVPPVVNSALAKMGSSRPIDRILSLSLDVGAYAPEIVSIACSPSYFSPDVCDVDVGLVMPGDGVHMSLDVAVGDDVVVRGEVGRCEVQGALRIKLGPLIAPVPCTKSLHFGFAAKPTLKPTTLFRIVDGSSLPRGVSLRAVERFVVRLVENVVDSTTCWPRAVAVPVAAAVLGPAYDDLEEDDDDELLEEDDDDELLEDDDGRTRRRATSTTSTASSASSMTQFFFSKTKKKEEAPRDQRRKLRQRSRHIRSEDAAVGTLRVEVQRCSNLSIFDKAKNPYVVCKVGQVEERTTTQTGTLDPVWRAPRTFVFDVHEASQLCSLNVYNSDMNMAGAFNDPLLGRAHFSLHDLEEAARAGMIGPPSAAAAAAASGHPPLRRSASLGRTPPTELRLALDTSGNDTSTRDDVDPAAEGAAPPHLAEKNKASPNTDAAIYILAKFSKARGLDDLAKGRANGPVPLGLAALYVVSFAFLIDLLARRVLLLVASTVAVVFVALVAASAFLFAWVFITGLLTLNLKQEASAR